jgi:hypothetical protein
METEAAQNEIEETKTPVPTVEAVDQSSQDKETKPEPTPTAEKVETKPEEVKEKDEGQSLDSQILAMQQAEEERKAEQIRVEIERREAVRNSLLQEEYKILKAEYMALAPSSEHADPTTEEGRETLRQWVNANPGLFGKAPELPQSDGKQEKTTIFGNRGWTWADKWRDQR